MMIAQPAAVRPRVGSKHQALHGYACCNIQQKSKLLPKRFAADWLRPRSLTTSSRAEAVGAPTSAGVDNAASVATTGFDWKNQWYPLGFERNFNKDLPTRFMLLGEPVVVWWSGTTKSWNAFLDRCPHRLVPLSEGRVTEDGQLQCPYHGWEFSPKGNCTAIPQGGKFESPRACSTVYSCTTAQQLLWVKPVPLQRGPDLQAVQPEVDLSELSLVRDLDEEAWNVSDSFRDVPLDYSTVVENLIDVAHIPFTHHNTMGNRAFATPMMDLSIENSTDSSFRGEWLPGPNHGMAGGQITTFDAPCLVQHRIGNKDSKGFRVLVSLYAVPMEPGKTRLIMRSAAMSSKLSANLSFKLRPAFLTCISQLTLLEDDQIFLHRGERVFAKARESVRQLAKLWYSPSQQDAYVYKFYDWMATSAGNGPWGNMTLADLSRWTPEQDKNQLLDRQSQHVDNCSTCQSAVRRLTLASKVTRALAAVLVLSAAVCTSVAFSMNSGASATVLASSSSVVQDVASKLFMSTSAHATMNRAIYMLVGAGVMYTISNAVKDYLSQFQSGTWPAPRNDIVPPTKA